jgi:hypothetical protein
MTLILLSLSDINAISDADKNALIAVSISKNTISITVFPAFYSMTKRAQDALDSRLDI